jgi:hypothetical protein
MFDVRDTAIRLASHYSEIAGLDSGRLVKT